MNRQVLALDPKTYRRHPIHGEGRIWAETNCYVDVWVELAHAFGHEPEAALPFTFGIDFEGDQWTFFKFPLQDLDELFGLHTEELAIWRSIVEHLEEQIGRGRPVLIEVDSFYLPDTAGTAYKLAHVKTTIGAVAIDLERETLGYFHGQGYYEVTGEDFRALLRLHDQDPAMLPPYAELVKPRARSGDQDATLVPRSLALLQRHLRLLPESNPFVSFKARLTEDLATLLESSLDTFHQYSFATLRQYGACYELSATYLQWLVAHGESGLDELTEAFLSLSRDAKAFQFQLARSMARRKPLDVAPLDTMAATWETATRALRARYG
jgi:hypothetical protein